jgi:ERCC4-type nuclease
MIELGRKSRTDIATKDLISTLSAGSLYEQLLSLETCYGSRDITIAFQALSSSSKHLKKRAINAIILLGTNDELLAALNSVPIYLQIQTIRRVRDLRPSRKRPQVIE